MENFYLLGHNIVIDFQWHNLGFIKPREKHSSVLPKVVTPVSATLVSMVPAAIATLKLTNVKIRFITVTQTQIALTL